ncbi:hypothetical protein LPN04_26575 [Rugamonas sp. A1-17]|nr:hypothetical protein [Rugamonas sp. A1-17]
MAKKFCNDNPFKLNHYPALPCVDMVGKLCDARNMMLTKRQYSTLAIIAAIIPMAG